MAYIYVDNFESSLAYALSDAGTTIYLPEPDAARVQAAMAFGGGVTPSIAGPRFMRVPLFIGAGAQRELVFATHYAYGGFAVVRTAGLSFSAGAVVRCAPPADIVAAGHMMTRVGTSNEVIAAPGERGVLQATGTQITVWVALGGGMPPNFAGDDWPSEVVIRFAGEGERTLQFKDFNGYPQDFLREGGAGSQSALVIPETCLGAVLRVRKVPSPLEGMTQLLVAVELY